MDTQEHGALTIQNYFQVNFVHCLQGCHSMAEELFQHSAIPAAAGLGVGSAGMKPIFYVSIIVFILGTVVWCFLPETMKKEQK